MQCINSSSRVRVLSFNVAKNYLYLDVVLETCKSDFDLLFIQEPPWRLIRHAPSAKDPLGESVVGAPMHPDWSLMVRHRALEDDHPRVVVYASKRLVPLCLSLRFDIVDDRDILVLSLFKGERALDVANVYLDNNGSTIHLLSEKRGVLSNLVAMAGDFNCHSAEWDPLVRSSSGRANNLLSLVGDLGLGLAHMTNSGPTFTLRTQGLRQSVLDLVFVESDSTLSSQY